MTTRTIAIEHGDITLYGQIATVEKTHLGWQDHGILTADLVLSWPGAGISVGGYRLDRLGTGTEFGLDQIMRIMETVGVQQWEHLVGKQVIVLFEEKNSLGSRAVGIASTTDESRVLVFADHAKEWFGVVKEAAR